MGWNLGTRVVAVARNVGAPPPPQKFIFEQSKQAKEDIFTQTERSFYLQVSERECEREREGNVFETSTFDQWNETLG